MSQPFVAILMGSDSDFPQVEPAVDTLKKLGIPVEVKVTSAHRTPEITHAYVKDADKRGCSVFICAAGMAAHLAGAVSANTVKPVIGIPIGYFFGDLFLSTYAYKIEITPALILIGLAIVGALGMLTVWSQTWRAASSNPVKSLRYE